MYFLRESFQTRGSEGGATNLDLHNWVHLHDWGHTSMLEETT